MRHMKPDERRSPLLFSVYFLFLCTALDHYVHPVTVNRAEKEHMNRTCTQFSNT